MSQERANRIREQLTAAFSPKRLEIVDESHHHAGHASARGGGHFAVTVVSGAFAGKSLVERHRMVFSALADDMQRNEIHALSINALTPVEAGEPEGE